MRRIPHVAAIICIAALAAGFVRADGFIVAPPPHPVPGQPYAFAPLAVKYHHVTVTITDQVAVTEVDQSFFNPTSARLEGYIFPIPAGAQIDRFAMDIDGKMTEAELLDATKARQIYEDIVRRMRDPALMEYSSARGCSRCAYSPSSHAAKNASASATPRCCARRAGWWSTSTR